MQKAIILLITIIFLGGTTISAQTHRRCGHDIIVQNLKQRDPIAYQKLLDERKATLERIQNEAETQRKSGAKTTATTYTIPVVFHVLLTSSQLNELGGNAGVIARINSQMNVINHDYNRGNADSTLIPSVFKSLYGNVGIKFALATKTPSGSAATGYEIKTVANSAVYDAGNAGTSGSGYFCSDAKYASSGIGYDAWDVTKYLNIWICKITENGTTGILGITDTKSGILQYGDPIVEEGVVLNYNSFGKRVAPSDSYIDGIDQGRTLTHELGHFFNIWHIWGDDNGACPGQSGYHDDGINDTPIQADMNYKSPIFPLVSCSVSAPNGDMFMNYMDYVDDAAMQMFTLGQINAMRYYLTTENNPLTTHPELTDVSNLAHSNNSINIYPNPTNGNVNIVFNQLPSNLQNISISNLLGQTVVSLPNQNSINYNVDLTNFPKGVYFVKCSFNEETITQKIILQ